MEKGHIPTRLRLEKAVRILVAKGTLNVRRHPVPFHGWLAVGIDHSHLRPDLPSVVEVLHHHRLVIDIGCNTPEKDHQVGANQVSVGASGTRYAQGRFKCKSAGRVAHAGAFIDIVCAQRPRRLLRRVVGFVGDPRPVR